MRREGLEEVLSRARELVTPSADEERRLRAVAAEVLRALSDCARGHGLSVEVEVEGSVAKGTWLPGDRDIDVFLLFDRRTSLEELRYWGLRLAREAARALGCGFEERYAEHPYLRLSYKGYEVDVVPSYRVESGDEVVTAVDRTRLHTRYVLSKADERLKVEVRLLKRFMKAVGVYGAEVKVGGFSGYLCELLVIHYGSFLGVLRAARGWRPWRVVVDPGGHYSEAERGKLRRAFKSPLVVIDPVDRTRNAAAAVTLQRFSEFVAASRAFLERPSLKFFIEEEVEPMSRGELEAELEERGTGLIALRFDVGELSPDVLWGQVHRTVRNVLNFLKQYKFEVVNWGAWSDDRSIAIVLLELSSLTLSPVELHSGPPVGSPEEPNFLRKYLGSAVAGPFIVDGKWYVLRRRKYADAVALLRERIHLAGLAKSLLKALREGRFRVYVNSEVAEASSDEGYRRYLRKWLLRRYHWLGEG
ncbi:MAG: CCA tRNA nucleotidyltransferase [Thermoprotei archaeon]|nr:MAG: CCA tRNA nucleotidyltransferase [Thermoprotei archaeon]